MRRITTSCARHPWRVIAAWAVAVLVGAGLTGAFIGDLTLLGDANWYLPSWLRWLPDLHVEHG